MRKKNKTTITRKKPVGRMANIQRVARACKVSETRIQWALNGLGWLSRKERRTLRRGCPGDAPKYLKKLAFGW